MASYFWTEHTARSLADRYPAGTLGREQWQRGRTGEDRRQFLVENRKERRLQPARPCLFVSHRQVDVEPAKRIAQLAAIEGFDYWLDVLDPTLGGLGTGEMATTVAAIIEMALLNSTHVMAVITPNTKGSVWVPYEYGRVKDPAPVTLQAACWAKGSVPTAELPEYLHLGVIARSEHDVSSWLRTEASRYPGGAPTKPNTWGGGATSQLT